MQAYLKTMKRILKVGKRRGDRTGVGTYGIFAEQLRFNLTAEFPILTTKEVHWPSVVNELLWFISGRTDVQWLQERNVRIWNEWATEEQCAKFGRPAGQLGPIYGHQWRNFGATVAGVDGSKTIIAMAKEAGGPVTYSHSDADGNPLVYLNNGFDQLEWLVNEIKTNPESRRLILSGWNPKEANNVSLPPCHTLAQFYVSRDASNRRMLSCHLYQRSADYFLGVPFNIASYALLTHLIAHVCDMGVGEFVWTGGDVHLYSNHLAAVNHQLQRAPGVRPELKLDPSIRSLFDFKLEHIRLDGYLHQGKISAPVAV